MSKLLKANFTRLWKNKVFLISSALMFMFSLSLLMVHYMDNINGEGGWTLDDGFFSYAMIIAILVSVFSALFIGTEYSDGTIRNKIIAGHTRVDVYLSNLIVCSVAGLTMCTAFMIPQFCVGIPLLGKFEADIKAVILIISVTFSMAIALSALFVLIAMLCHNKASSAIACILLAFTLLFAGIRITAALNEPEYYSAYSYIENGVTVSEEKSRNSNYISGTKRELYEFMKDFLPGGQAIELANMEADNLGLLAVYDLVILVAATGCGMMLFKKKDIK